MLERILHLWEKSKVFFSTNLFILFHIFFIITLTIGRVFIQQCVDKRCNEVTKARNITDIATPSSLRLDPDLFHTYCIDGTTYLHWEGNVDNYERMFVVRWLSIVFVNYVSCCFSNCICFSSILLFAGEYQRRYSASGRSTAHSSANTAAYARAD